MTIRLTIGNDDDDDDDDEDDDDDDKNDKDDEEEDIMSMECRARVKLAVRHFHRATALSARSSGGSWGGAPPGTPPGTPWYPPWSWGGGGRHLDHSFLDSWIHSMGPISEI